MSPQRVIVGEQEYEFPDNMSDAEIAAALKLDAPAPGPARTMAPAPEPPQSFFDSMNQAASFEGYPGPGSETLGQVPIENAAPAVLGTLGAIGGTAIGQPFWGGTGGAAAGHVIKNLMKMGRGEAIDAEQAATDATADMILGGLGSAGGAKLAPTVTPAEAETIKYAAEQGVPLSADLLHPSWFTKSVAWFGNAFLPGRWLGNKYRKELFAVNERLANDLVAGAASEPAVREAMAGKPLKEGMRAARLEFSDIAKKGYAAQEELAREYGGQVLDVPKFRQAIGGLLNNAEINGQQKLVKYLKNLLTQTEEGKITFREAVNVYNRINKNIGGRDRPWAASNLFDALLDDVGTWGKMRDADVAKVFTEAKEKWKDKKTFDIVYNLFNRSSKADEFGNVYFNPDTMLDMLSNPSFPIRSQLERTFGKEGAEQRMKALNNFANLMYYARQEATREVHSQGGKWTSLLGPGDALMGMTGLAAAGSPMTSTIGKAAWIPVPWGISMVATMQTLKPTSAMKSLMRLPLGKFPPRLVAGAGAATGIGTYDLVMGR